MSLAEGSRRSTTRSMYWFNLSSGAVLAEVEFTPWGRGSGGVWRGCSGGVREHSGAFRLPDQTVLGGRAREVGRLL